MEIEYRRPKLYPLQQNAIFDPRRYSLIEASTKAGKTVGCIAWLFELALFGKDGDHFWWVAPVFGTADIAYRRMKRAIRAELFSCNETARTITLANGATIWFKSGDKPDTLYGEDVQACVVDEASRIKEEAWFAIRSTLTATRGRIRLIGNVKGKRNWFYRLARRAEAEQGVPDYAGDMSYHKITAYDAVSAGVLVDEEIADAQRILPEAVFRELYLAEPSDDQGNPFGYQAIRDCVAPLSSASPVAWGWDLAKSVDWTVGIGLDRSGHVCRFQRFQRPWRDTIPIIRKETARCAAMVDSTGVGDPVLEELQANGGSNFEGFKFTSPSKQQLMEGLSVAIQRQELHYPEGIIVLELEQFEYEYTRTGVRYSAPEGMHDDAVCALALAVKCRSERRGLSTWAKLGADAA